RLEDVRPGPPTASSWPLRGLPYDEGYESRNAEADAHRALEELRSYDVACLCLSIGASTPTDALHRVFSSASHARTPPPRRARPPNGRALPQRPQGTRRRPSATLITIRTERSPHATR